MFYFYVVASVQRRPLLCRGGGLVGPRLPSRVGRRVAFCGWFCHADGLALPGRLAAGRRQGGLRAVVLCGGGAVVVGAVMPRHSGSPSHSTLIPAHQPVIRPPYIITCSSSLHRPWTRTHREVDLRTDIWLSGCASGRGEAGAETGVAASLCLFPFSPVPTYRISSGR